MQVIDRLNKLPLYLRLFAMGKRYFVRTPGWLKLIYHNYCWGIDTKEKKIYLSFDDGPDPVATVFVLDLLKKYNAKASFFCVGSQVAKYPELFQRIILDCHAIGNHSYSHPNGWKTGDDAYLRDVQKAQELIDSPLFRPPYGRIRRSQFKKLPSVMGQGSKVIMWSVLSGDFDPRISKEKCAKNVITKVREGSIVVFHDSRKAFPHLEYALPVVLEKLSGEGYTFEKLEFR